MRILLLLLIGFTALSDLPIRHSVNASSAITLTPTLTDATFIDPWHNKTIFGVNNYLNASANTANKSTAIFLKFDISGLPANTNVKVLSVNLTLTLVNSSSMAGGELAAYAEYNSSWSASSLTYTNAPRSNISTVPNDPKFVNPTVTTWNVTKIVKSQLGVNSTVSIVLHNYGTPSSNTILLFKSKNAGSSQPTLTVTYNKNLSHITLDSPATQPYGFPVVLGASTTILVNGTVTLANQVGTTAIQYSLDNKTWTTIYSATPDKNGTAITVWNPPQAGVYFIRSTWSGGGSDPFAQDSTSEVARLLISRAQTTTTLLIGTSTLGYGNETLLIARVIATQLGIALSEGTVIVESSVDDGSSWTPILQGAPFNGLAYQTFSPSQTGNLLFRARWLGDLNYQPSTSDNIPLTVTKAQTLLTFSLGQAILEAGSITTLSGSLRTTGGSAISGAAVTIQIASQSNPNTFTNLTTFTTDTLGLFNLPWAFRNNGTYQVRAVFDGTLNYNSALSRSQQVYVALQVFPTTGEAGLIGGILGFLIGVGFSFLFRFRRSASVKRRQHHNAPKKQDQGQR